MSEPRTPTAPVTPATVAPRRRDDARNELHHAARGLSLRPPEPSAEEAHRQLVRERIAFALILLVAIGLRLQGLFHDLPFSYYGDELHFVKRSMALGTGDLNPHWFHKPAFLMYLLLGSYGTYFLVGRAVGLFDSVEAFGASFLVDTGPFLLIGRLLVLAFGVALVVLGYRIARRVHGVGAARTTALFLAILPAMVAGSQVVKADVPSTFFVVAAVWAYLRSRDGGSWRWLLASGALAGASMGTKYYGVIVVPGLLVAESLAHWSAPRRFLVLARRFVVLGAVFVAAFFVTSPYNFLDPFWSDSIRGKMVQITGWQFLAPDGADDETTVAATAVGEGAVAENATDPGTVATNGAGGTMPVERPTSSAPEVGEAGATRFDPDAGVEYEPGLGSVPGAFLHFLGKLTGWKSLGPPFAILALLGGLSMLRRRDGPWTLAVLGTPVLVFALFASTLAAYHTNPRQLNAIFPLCGVLVWPGAVWITGLFRVRGRVARALPVVLVALAAIPMLQLTLRRNDRLLRPDSRKLAYEWIITNVPSTDRILLDDYGPIVQPNEAAVARLQTRLEAMPTREAFTEHQGKQLELREAYPYRDGRDVEVLGHPWWLARETPDEELRMDPYHLDMGNPLVDRTPRTLDDYRREGFRWIVTNSEARARYYATEAAGEAFPSFRRFYDSLADLTAVSTFDPKQSGGKGPVVWIYDLGKG